MITQFVKDAIAKSIVEKGRSSYVKSYIDNMPDDLRKLLSKEQHEVLASYSFDRLLAIKDNVYSLFGGGAT